MTITAIQMQEYATAHADAREGMTHEVNVGIAAARKRARDLVTGGAVTQSHGVDHGNVLRLLNDALATELVCMMRYRRHYFMARGVMGQVIGRELLANSNEELSHADRIAGRIVQLGGEPDLHPARIAERSHAEYVEGGSLAEMIMENLVAERIGIESYMSMIQLIGTWDTTTRRMLEDILAAEEEHAEELASMLESLAEESA